VGDYYDSQKGYPGTDENLGQFRKQEVPAKIWFRNGAEETLSSYVGANRRFKPLLKELKKHIDYAERKNEVLHPGYRAMVQGFMAILIPEEHIHFLRETCVDALETDNFIFAHGGLYPALQTLAEQPLIALHWYAPTETLHYQKDKKLVVGHTIKSRKPQDEGHYLNIDTGAYQGGGRLTCIDVMSGEYWQSGNDNGTIAMSMGKLQRRDPPLYQADTA
jgi:sRNA-binding regulator protein Hfq